MKVVFDFAGQKISLEGDGPELIELLQTARSIAPALSHIEINTVANRLSGAQRGDPQHQVPPLTQNGSGGSSSPLTGQTIKQFVRSLPLANASERIAAVAYYVKHHEGKEVFSPKDMDGWFSISAIPKPAQMPVAFFDAKRHHGYVESAGHGKWKLTTNGENLVVGKLNRAEEASV